MRIKFISPIGHTTPMLFETFVPTFESKGHSIVDDVDDADIVFIDLHSRLFDYDEKELWGAKTKQRIFVDMWDYGGCEDGTHIFPYIEHEQLKSYLFYTFTNEDIWFVRKLDKTKTIPPKTYPIELCLYPDHDFEPTTAEELFNRPNDICFIGNTSPTRENVCYELSKHFKCDFVLGQPRIDHESWLNRARQAKMFLTADGGGFSDERPYQLITIAAMVKQRNNQLVLNDFVDGIDCIKVNEQLDVCEYISLKMALEDATLLHKIYLNGIEHMKKYYTFEYRANMILETIQKHLNL